MKLQICINSKHLLSLATKHVGAKSVKKRIAKKKINLSTGEFLVATSSFGCPTERPFQPFGLCMRACKVPNRVQCQEEYNA